MLSSDRSEFTSNTGFAFSLFERLKNSTEEYLHYK